MNKIKILINNLEEYICFPIRRDKTALDSGKPHDESFSYGLCQRFYEDKKGLDIAIKMNEKIIFVLLKEKIHLNQSLSLLFSLLGDMYYLKGDFTRSMNCFMKALSYDKVEIANWVGLVFSLRSNGKIDLFEDIMFNFRPIYNLWENSASSVLDQEKLLDLIRNS